MPESPALDILALLAKRGAVLSYSDPLVPRLNLDGLELCSEPMEEAAKNADCVIIVTDHSSVTTLACLSVRS